MNSEGLPEDSRVTPEQITETDEETPEKDPNSEKETDDSSKPPEKPRAKLSMEKLMMVCVKKLPSSMEEIPEYLYRPGSKQYETARLIIMKGITDNATLHEQTKLSVKTIYNVESAIRKLVEEISGTQEGNSGNSGTPITPIPSKGNTDPHGPSRTPEILPRISRRAKSGWSGTRWWTAHGSTSPHGKRTFKSIVQAP